MSIIDIIEYRGNNDTFIWRFPGEDFNTFSQLVVRESQEALLFLNGQALDVFPPGRHTLHTQNIPLLRNIINIPTGGESPFKCEVYFINKAEQMAIKWGVGDINYLDPTMNNYKFVIGASGEMSLRVSDSRKLITKIVGTETELSQERVKQYFKTPLQMHIKSMLPKILRENHTAIYEVESNLSELAEILKTRISEEILDYGIFLEKFWINTIVKPESDSLYQTVNRQRGEKITLLNQGELDIQKADIRRKVEIIDFTGEMQKKNMETDAKRYEQEQLGDSYIINNRTLDVMGKFAENEGSGSDLRNAAMGIGMGMGAGSVLGKVMENMSHNTMRSDFSDPAKPTAADTNTIENAPDDTRNLKEKSSKSNKEVFKEKLEMLSMMKDLLTEEEYKKEKEQLLEMFRKDGGFS